jgi:hypothetical protein
MSIMLIKTKNIMKRIQKFTIDNNLSSVIHDSGMANMGKGKGTYKYVQFGKQGLSGKVNIYGQNFISIDYKTKLKGLPKCGMRIYKSIEDVIMFLRLAFVESKYFEALKVETINE